MVKAACWLQSTNWWTILLAYHNWPVLKVSGGRHRLNNKFQEIRTMFRLITHGIPEELTTDNGPLHFAEEMDCYAKKMWFKHHPVTPLDPQSNRFAETFVKLNTILHHTPQQETPLQNFYLAVKCSQRKKRRKQQTRSLHNKRKMLQKVYAYNRRNPKKKQIPIGDEVLIRQNKTMIKPPFDHSPFK